MARRVRYRSHVREYLKRHGISGAWFIRETGISQYTYYAVESGRMAAGGFYRRAALAALADHGAKIEELFEELPPDVRPPASRPMAPETLAMLRAAAGRDEPDDRHD